jgi:uroporphyrinogen decarboxylase
MPQTPHEVVWNAITFNNPDRLPINMPLLGRSDFHHVGWNQVGTGDRTKKQTLDEWGCLWVRNETENMGQVKGFPLEDWNSLAHYRWLDPDDPGFYEGMEGRFDGSEGKFVTTGIFMLLFERMHALHGFENTLVDLRLEPERMAWLADRIVEIDLGIMENIARRFPGRVHGFNFTDDWGTEQDIFVHPELWDEFFKAALPDFVRRCA